MNRKSRRGAALVLALFISVLLLLVGLGFLGQREGQYQAAREQISFVQAKSLANAGLEDALGKLAKDIDFPPIRSNDQSSFSYTDEILDGSGKLVGTYRVTISGKYRSRPYEVLQISSIGVLGDPIDPIARVKRTTEVDMAPNVRVYKGSTNPDTFKRHFTTTNSW